MYSLYGGYLIKVYNVTDNLVWDAENHDMMLCRQFPLIFERFYRVDGSPRQANRRRGHTLGENGYPLSGEERQRLSIA